MGIFDFVEIAPKNYDKLQPPYSEDTKFGEYLGQEVAKENRRCTKIMAIIIVITIILIVIMAILMFTQQTISQPLLGFGIGGTAVLAAIILFINFKNSGVDALIVADEYRLKAK